jgi:hypothetical protein
VPNYLALIALAVEEDEHVATVQLMSMLAYQICERILGEPHINWSIVANDSWFLHLCIIRPGWAALKACRSGSG